MIHLFIFLLVGFPSNIPLSNSGAFAKALWFLHAYGHADCSSARNDKQVKSTLVKSFANDRELSHEEVSQWISLEVFRNFAGEDDQISELELASALDSAVPQSRREIIPELCSHAEFLATSFDMIEPEHYASMDQLSEWIAQNWQPNNTLHVLTACTKNSRRSILSAMMGNLAATYYGLDNVRFHSGGTTPTAFNNRTIATLKEIGFQIEPTGEEAERGDPKIPNLMFRVHWGKGMETIEYSKSYKDESIPQSELAAIFVCNEADSDCPVLPDASIRVSMTFLDPKSYDDSAFESKKYAERRDDIGRTFLAIMANARRKILERNTKK